MKNMAFARIGNWSVIVNSRDNPTNADWEAMLEDTKTFQYRLQGTLVYTEGGSPTPRQRKQLREVLSPETRAPKPTAILTSSIIVRVAVTAFNIFFRNQMLALDPSRYQEGLKHMGVPLEDWPVFLKTIEDLARVVGAKSPFAEPENLQSHPQG
jgi:hypothetical protein